MKKLSFILLLCAMASLTFAQLKVASEGNVGIVPVNFSNQTVTTNTTITG